MEGLSYTALKLKGLVLRESGTLVRFTPAKQLIIALAISDISPSASVICYKQEKHAIC